MWVPLFSLSFLLSLSSSPLSPPPHLPFPYPSSASLFHFAHQKKERTIHSPFDSSYYPFFFFFPLLLVNKKRGIYIYIYIYLFIYFSIFLMEGTLRGGGSGGGSTTGSVSTVSKEDNLVMSSEVSSSYPDESEIELGLGLSLGFGGDAAMAKSKTAAPWGQYARILTAKDFPSVVSKASSSSSSSSGIRANNNNTSCGTKRSAESFSPPRSGVSQVVGWPPVRASRINSLVNLAKSPTSEDCNLTAEKGKSRSGVLDKIDGGRSRNNSKARGFTKNSLFVKVNMDGIPIGRKVDLSVHNCYETLARTLDDMFCGSSTNMSSRTSFMEEHVGRTDATGSLRLLDGSSDFVLTYEDKEGDWMLVGDVPWEMFISSVKRLRIMRTSEANGLAPRSEERSERERIKPI